jgi:enterochelin esterase-like enzyme
MAGNCSIISRKAANKMNSMNLSPVLVSACLTFMQQPSPPLEIGLAFSKNVCSEAFTGRVFVIASKNPINEQGNPPGPAWFNPYPFFAQEVTKWSPDTPLKFQPKLAFPQPWEKLAKQKYYLQAVLDRDLCGRTFNSSPGNAYSKPVMVDLNAPPHETIKLIVDQVIPEQKLEDKGRVKFVELESKLLSKFHGRPIKLRAGVVVPKSFAANPKEKYAVIYEIPGFGGDHRGAFFATGRTDVAGVEILSAAQEHVTGVVLPLASDLARIEMLYVVLDPGCRLGHHVFADSENNGPYGKALIEELIPHIEANFRGLGAPTARFVTGHSSGGWSSLWLQVTYPDFFGGVWSTAPDSVDFRDFQLVNIYDPKQNLFVDEKGEERPLARKGKFILLRYKPFSDMEVVMGRGGQLFSFEAVFSPRGPDGKPQPLWDRNTGVIDPRVAKAWQRYDIRMLLEQNWKTLGPKLAGKLHVYMGAEDTFYLNGATRLLQESQKKLGSDAVIEIFPGRDHGNLLDAALRRRIAREMSEAYRKKSVIRDKS